jgi:putative restriction endonuclease
METAFHHGVATQKRKTEPPEIVVSVSPEFLLWYVEEGTVLHRSEDDHAEVTPLVNATPEIEREFLDTSENESEAARRYRLVETMRAFREARFRPTVLQAYSHQCAVCHISLNLVDAAHIIPVRQPGSTDEIINGLALCRLHHAAFDNGLIGIRPDYRIVENPRAIARLNELNFLRGIDEFRQMLRASIRHPVALEVRPKPEYLRRGMELRNFAPDLFQ